MSTRRAILDAAEALFSEQGFANTSMIQVAERSGITKSLIHHHFGSKAKLWDEVKTGSIAGYRAVQLEVLCSIDKGPATLQRSVRDFFHFLQQNPRAVRMLSWMLLEGSEHSGLDPEMNRQAHERIVELQVNGLIRPDVEPVTLLIQFFSLTLHYFQCRDEFRRMFPHLDRDAMDGDYLESVLKVLLDGFFREKQVEPVQPEALRSAEKPEATALA